MKEDLEFQWFRWTDHERRCNEGWHTCERQSNPKGVLMWRPVADKPEACDTSPLKE